MGRTNVAFVAEGFSFGETGAFNGRSVAGVPHRRYMLILLPSVSLAAASLQCSDGYIQGGRGGSAGNRPDCPLGRVGVT